MENRELKIKLMAIQGILNIFKESELIPASLTAVDAITMTVKTLEVFKDEIIESNEFKGLNILLRELLDEVGSLND